MATIRPQGASIDLAHALEMEVTAEGIDTAGALALLRMMGCDLIQGYALRRRATANISAKGVPFACRYGVPIGRRLTALGNVKVPSRCANHAKLCYPGSAAWISIFVPEIAAPVFRLNGD